MPRSPPIENGSVHVRFRHFDPSFRCRRRLHVREVHGVGRPAGILCLACITGFELVMHCSQDEAPPTAEAVAKPKDFSTGETP